MKIILDTDGTLTDFNDFVKKNAYDFFQKKYHMEIKFPEKLEIAEIFDMENFFMEKYNCNKEDAKEMTEKALNDFWISYRFIKFSLFGKFRPGARDFILSLIKQGHEIEIHTSRDKTTDNDIIGHIARKFTILQYRLNGIFIPEKNFYFYKNDDDKINGILSSNAELIFEDKSEIIETLSSKGMKCICVEGSHNKNIIDNKDVKKISDFNIENLKNTIEELYGSKNLAIYERCAKSDILFNRLMLGGTIVDKYFSPIVVNQERMLNPKREGVIYAPNHRSTLDPIIITEIVNANIHWAALLRFFKGTDSIFNNSKNPALCKLTSKMFKRLEYFPIDRKSDNPEANNFASIKEMLKFLKANQKIGIFPEGTTRRPEGEKFGTFDDAFLTLAKKTDSWVQPVTTLWIEDLNLRPKVIINFGKPFKIGDMSIQDAYKLYISIQEKCLEENEKIKENLSKGSKKL